MIKNGKLIVALISICLSLVITLSGTLYHFGSKMGALELRVSTLWRFYVEDALSEATRHGEIEHRSPYVVTDSLLHEMIMRLHEKSDSMLVEIFMCLVIKEELPEDDADLAALIVDMISVERLLLRARIFKMSPSNYIAIWTVLVRQVQRMGIEKFLNSLQLDDESRGRYTKVFLEIEKRKQKGKKK